MRLACLAVLAALFAGGCSGRHAPVRPVAPSESAAVRAVWRVAARDHRQKVEAVFCDAAREDGSRVCDAILVRTCDSYAVRRDRDKRLRVSHSDAACYWIGPANFAAPTRIE
jgi:hypothetical protein